MQLQEILYSQGFGSRRTCAGLIEQGRVSLGGETCVDPQREFAVEGLQFTVSGRSWPYHAPAYLMLHKPPGTECSHKPKSWDSVYSLLPSPLRQRPQKGAVAGVQAVGRLDQDTTGLLLLTDDGLFIHRMNSPRHRVPKVYEVTTAEAVDALQVGRLLAGVVLNDDPQPVRAAACVISGDRSLQLTLTQGKYHQVKRMVAAVGNQVVGLHRSSIGSLSLPADLAPGQWRWLTAAEVDQLR